MSERTYISWVGRVLAAYLLYFALLVLSTGCTGPAGPMGPQGVRGPPGQVTSGDAVLSWKAEGVFDAEGYYSFLLPREAGTDYRSVFYQLIVEGNGAVFRGVAHDFQESSSNYYAVGAGLDAATQRIQVTVGGYSGQKFWVTILVLHPTRLELPDEGVGVGGGS